jgi:hypothetical protein
MTELPLLQEKLKQSIDWPAAPINFLACFLVAFLVAKTVTLNQIANAFPGAAKPASHLQRIERFLSEARLPHEAFAHAVVALLSLPQPWVLALDRTNWQLGKKQINLLVLAIVHQGVAFPILWSVLDKKGASNTDERIALLARFLALFGKDAVHFVVADREFIGKRWFSFLLNSGVSFRIRVKNDTLIADARGQAQEADELFCRKTKNKAHLFKRSRFVWGLPMFAGGKHRADGQTMVIVSDVAGELLDDYRLRWSIETLFGCLKSRGFNLEATHVTIAERLSRLLGLLAIAFVWSWRVGAARQERAPVPLKKHGRMAVSVFRRGLDYLRRLCYSLCGKSRPAAFLNAVDMLGCCPSTANNYSYGT